MPKNIVFFADGTWNHPGQTDDGLPADTNVVKLFRAAVQGATQITNYDDGVGADGMPVDHLLGGAMGDGLFQKIKQGYSFIAHAYDPGDQIFLFGFSRGAYTVRSLAGLIAVCGLPDQARLSDQAVNDAFNAYRARKQSGAVGRSQDELREQQPERRNRYGRRLGYGRPDRPLSISVAYGFFAAVTEARALIV